MKSDVIGRVGNVRLSPSRCLAPLFEAIVNSIQAIDERSEKGGQIDVFVERDTSQHSMEEEKPIADQPVSGFVVQDNGIGFNDSNFESFDTSDTTSKRARGGKGVGRFLWLKAFERAEVESVFQENGSFRKRQFNFTLTRKGVQNQKCKKVEVVPVQTTVRLVRFKPRYQQYCPKSSEKIAHRIIEHFLELFILKTCPTIILHDEYEDTLLNLNRLFNSEMRLDSKPQQFQIKNHPFRLNHVRLLAGRTTGHTLAFCAHDRTVRTENLCKLIPNLEGPLTEPKDDKQFCYAGYVSSKFLDERIAPDRTEFDMSDEKPELEFGDELSWAELRDTVAAKSQAYLAPFTEPVSQAKRDRISVFVQTTAPQYRHLLKQKPQLIDRIPVSVSDDKLDLELHKIDQVHEGELKERYQKLLADGDAKALSVEERRKRFEQFLEDWNEAGMSKLARHVVHRKATIDFLDYMLGLQKDGKYALEQSIHEVVFPLRATSDDVRPENMNLWILDEKLAYHYYLASDKALSQMKDAVEVDSQERPDIVIFNRPFAFADSAPKFGAIVIVEFKRPVRDDYSEQEGKDPIRQVDDYVELIKSGKAKDRRGRPITVPENTPFYAYVVCDLTPTLRKQAEFAQLTPTPDSLGYFGYHRHTGLYIEVIGFDKVIADAKKRNAALFEKLGIGVTPKTFK